MVEDDSSHSAISYTALAIGIIAVLGVILVLILYFVMKPVGQPGPPGPTGPPGPGGNIVRYPINTFTSYGNPTANTTNKYTFDQSTVIKGVSEFSLNPTGDIITYNGPGGWYTINTSSLFKGESGLKWLVVILFYNGNNIIQTINPSTSYDDSYGYLYTFNGSYMINLKQYDTIRLDSYGSYPDVIAMQPTGQNYISFQQL